ncbi:MAG: hypothetical protein ACQEQ0_13370 [Bacteroidota bacterium]
MRPSCQNIILLPGIKISGNNIDHDDGSMKGKFQEDHGDYNHVRPAAKAIRLQT